MGADWVTEPSDDHSRETREVYALAGLALYCAQCLEHETVNALALLALLRRRLSKPATTPQEETEYESYADSVWDQAFRKTLGGLVQSLRKSGLRVPIDLEDDLRRSLDARNRLVHSYFRDRAESWFTPAGRRVMADELAATREQFTRTDRALHELTQPIRAARGITDRALNRYLELRTEGLSENQAMDIVAEEGRKRQVDKGGRPPNE